MTKYARIIKVKDGYYVEKTETISLLYLEDAKKIAYDFAGMKNTKLLSINK